MRHAGQMAATDAAPMARQARERPHIVVRGLDVDFEQLLLDALQVFSGSLEEDLVELAEVNARAATGSGFARVVSG